tara:strand:+ start:858 stop:1073 length:216 start_codon:yes stop_codon:yes gene_type:complete
MAYTRDETGLVGKITPNSAGKYEWSLGEFYKDAEIVGKTGTFSGKTVIAKGTEDDYDAASAALKTALVAAG